MKIEAHCIRAATDSQGPEHSHRLVGELVQRTRIQNDVVRPLALGRGIHLRSHDLLRIRPVEPSVLHHACQAYLLGRVDEDHRIESALPTGLEEKRNLADHERSPFLTTGLHPLVPKPPDDGMHDRLQALTSLRVVEDDFPDPLPIHRPVGGEHGLAEDLHDPA